MQHLQCRHCGNKYNWREAFSKFGFDDGEGEIKTPHIAEVLEFAGYYVKYSKWLMHNELIYSIKKDGIEFMPIKTPEYKIGYDDPLDYLPTDILELLEEQFPTTILFR